MSKTDTTVRRERRLVGIAVSAGVAIGPVFGAAEPPVVITRNKIQAADMEAEASRLDAAILQSRKQLQKLKARLGVLPPPMNSEMPTKPSSPTMAISAEAPFSSTYSREMMPSVGKNT